MKKTLTLKWIREHRPCSEDGIKWFKKQKTNNIDDLFKNAMEQKRYEFVDLVMVKLMDKKQCVKYAIFAYDQISAESKEKNSDAMDPKGAVESARAFLRNPCKKTKAIAHYASLAVYTVYANYIFVINAADAAAEAAGAPDVVHAAYAAARAYAASYASSPATRIKILNYGYDLLKGN